MLIKLSKVFYFLILLYYGWFQVVFFSLPNMLLVLGVGMMFFIILHAMKTDERIFKLMPKELTFWIMFAVSSFITGIFVAVNMSHVLQSVTTFIEFLVLIYGMVYIAKQDRSIDFFINVFILFSVICGITTVFWGVDVGYGRMAMSYTDNPNSVGILMAVGISCILYKIDIRKRLYTLLYIGIAFFLVYVTMLTGSRKSYFSIIIILIYWLIFCFGKELKKELIVSRLITGLLFAIIVGIAYFVFYPLVKESSLFLRLSIMFKTQGDINRQDMYRVAFDMFKLSPIAGIGLNNYRDYYGGYSHSTYAELLACTGIIGIVFYITPFITICINYIKAISNAYTEANYKNKLRVMFGLYWVLVFLGIGVIHFYDMTSTIAFGLIFALYHIYNSENHEEVALPKGSM